MSEAIEAAELEDGYPTEETLNTISNWPLTKPGLFEFMVPIFEGYGRCEFNSCTDMWEIATGGWSGCEDALGAFRENFTLWAMTWYSSRRGGHHQFDASRWRCDT